MFALVFISLCFWLGFTFGVAGVSRQGRRDEDLLRSTVGRDLSSTLVKSHALTQGMKHSTIKGVVHKFFHLEKTTVTGDN